MKENKRLETDRVRLVDLAKDDLANTENGFSIRTRHVRHAALSAI